MHLFRSRPHAPIRRLHARRTQMLAGAAATVVAVGVLVGPTADLDGFGSVDRAQAAAAVPAAAPAPASPAFPGVTGVDLAALGYRGVDLDAVTVADLDRPLPELPMERASELRARIVVATAHVEGLREAEYLLYEASRSMKQDIRATRKEHEQALALQAEADAALARVRERAQEAAALAAEAAGPDEAPAPLDRPTADAPAPSAPDAPGPDRSPGGAPKRGDAPGEGRPEAGTPEAPGKTGKTGKTGKAGKAGKPGKPGKPGKAGPNGTVRPVASGTGGDPAGAEVAAQPPGSDGPMLAASRPVGDDAAAAERAPRAGRPLAEVIVLAAQVSHAEAVADRAAAATAAVDERLQGQIGRRGAHLFALDRTSSHVQRMDQHVEYLYNELDAARAGMRAAGRWLAEAERGRPDVPTAKVKDFRVHGSVASSLRDLLRAAFADGILLTNASSYRPIDRQIELRKQNCGPTPYDVYERPSGTCSPPTARPGRSLHESGLAIDFQHEGQSIVSRSSPAYQWLAANAPSYGFFNLPSEPWHWSVSGY